MSPSSVAEVEYRARAAGLSWPIALNEDELEIRLYPPLGAARRPTPHWADVYRELKRPGVTLQLI